MDQESTHIVWLQEQNKSLQELWLNKKMVQATLAQIQLDFAKFNLIIQIKDNFSLVELENGVENQLLNLTLNSPHKIPQLIYTIDLPEEIFNEIIRYSENVNSDLSKCIVVREAMKVYLRTKFSKG